MTKSLWLIWLRTILGFFLAPSAPVLLGVILQTLVDFMNGDAFRNLAGGIWAIKFACLLGYPIALILGLPLYFFFRSRGWNGILTYLIAGVCLGFFMYLVYMPPWGDLLQNPSWFFERVFYTVHLMLPGIIFGTMACIAFWLSVRPDKIKTYRFWDRA